VSANENHIAEAISAPASLRDGGALSAGIISKVVIVYFILCFVDKPLLFSVCLISLQKKK